MKLTAALTAGVFPRVSGVSTYWSRKTGEEKRKIIHGMLLKKKIRKKKI